MTGPRDPAQRTHLVEQPGGKRTLCGMKRDVARFIIWARFVTAHQQGHPDTFHPCEPCMTEAAARGVPLMPPKEGL